MFFNFGDSPTALGRLNHGHCGARIARKIATGDYRQINASFSNIGSECALFQLYLHQKSQN